jgi:hypothetical protein
MIMLGNKSVLAGMWFRSTQLSNDPPAFLLESPVCRTPGQESMDTKNRWSVEAVVNWILDLDLRDFFGTLKHEWLVRFVEHRIADQRVLRLIRKWLNAGVLEDGKRTRSEGGRDSPRREHQSRLGQYLLALEPRSGRRRGSVSKAISMVVLHRCDQSRRHSQICRKPCVLPNCYPIGPEPAWQDELTGAPAERSCCRCPCLDPCRIPRLPPISPTTDTLIQ